MVQDGGGLEGECLKARRRVDAILKPNLMPRVGMELEILDLMLVYHEL